MKNFPFDSWCRGDPQLEIWGGVECSAVRTSSGLYDQLERTGHAERDEDLEKFAALGLRTIRYPVLWDRHAGDTIDWTWADRRLGRLRELGIRPVVGLLHHGCGPLPGGFLDPGFIDGLAAFARAVAARYPWVDAYTPVNEPLTTARFSGLYGWWHPFHSDDASFARIFLRQCEGIRAAMAAIREINPRAELVQTEDVGKTHATAALVEQAEWENERRWLTFDLLSGKLGPDHPGWHFLRGAGLTAAELETFRARPCTPDLLGMNYYVTGERLLDDQIEKYPPELQGGNGRQVYVDVPAVRVRRNGLLGWAPLIREVWERYRRPMAITEVQLACTREEQMRWLAEAWRAAEQTRSEGVDIRAVTAWALIGAFDWDSLLLEHRNHYESGAFSLEDGNPHITAVGWMVQHLAKGLAWHHPVLDFPGWWRRPDRFRHPPVDTEENDSHPAYSEKDTRPAGPALFLAGFEKTAEERLIAFGEQRGISMRALSREDILEFHRRDRLWLQRPWGMILSTALSNGRFDHENERLMRRASALCLYWQAPFDFFPADPTSADAVTPALHKFIDRMIDRSAQELAFARSKIAVAC